MDPDRLLQLVKSPVFGFLRTPYGSFVMEVWVVQHTGDEAFTYHKCWGIAYGTQTLLARFWSYILFPVIWSWVLKGNGLEKCIRAGRSYGSGTPVEGPSYRNSTGEAIGQLVFDTLSHCVVLQDRGWLSRGQHSCYLQLTSAQGPLHHRKNADEVVVCLLLLVLGWLGMCCPTGGSRYCSLFKYIVCDFKYLLCTI
jgi:hypothetical protein